MLQITGFQPVGGIKDKLLQTRGFQAELRRRNFVQQGFKLRVGKIVFAPNYRVSNRVRGRAA
jgi:hypothetical protein